MVAAGEIVLATDIGPTFVTEDFYDSTSGTISTSEAVEATCSVTIPANWATYDLRAKALFRIVESGTGTGTRTVTMQLRKTGLAGTSGGVMAAVVSNDPATSPGNHENVAMGGKWAGETTTGSVSVVITMIITADSGQYSWDDMFLEVWAFRKT